MSRWVELRAWRKTIGGAGGSVHEDDWVVLRICDHIIGWCPRYWERTNLSWKDVKEGLMAELDEVVAQARGLLAS